MKCGDLKVDGMADVNVQPPRKRQRTSLLPDLQPRHQIWGRSDTNLLSFDVKRCQEFLGKFEREVLCGTALDEMDPKERVVFLKRRCQEFVKMLNEFRDYVLHLRVWRVL